MRVHHCEVRSHIHPHAAALKPTSSSFSPQSANLTKTAGVMGLMGRFLLLTAFALLTTLARSADSGAGRQLLRVADATDAEERGLPVPSFIKSGVTKWKTNARVSSWIKKQRSDKYVLTKLGLNGLTGEALTKNANFETFQKFKVGGWLKQRATTTEAWDNLGLDRFTGDEIMKADSFSVFVHYVTTLNNKAKQLNFEKWPPLLGGGSDKELLVKGLLLSTLGRGSIDRSIMLGTRGDLVMFRAARMQAAINKV
ncbi:hypothetical protein PHYPSEUDO_006766 [Phytophthora pseudosyringae]|uniref:RxLR effector protein n=1 Tax=Phytophthora pseudosyringae TaxID=221518 RepID=A0A8T1VIK7_9STRA|nr:hypothetical protein PHYPSEUDO_006766 [Phytophthora pseudosyringae]